MKCYKCNRDLDLYSFCTLCHDQLGSERDRLKDENERLRKANEILWDASFQSHTGHWDREGTSGANCPECIRARELREKAKTALQEVNDGNST